VTTYVDAVGALAAWINSRTATLVGAGRPLQKGATFKHTGGAASSVYALLEELPSRVGGGNEDPDMLAVISIQVCGGNRESATIAAVALANELTGELNGRPRVVVGVATLQVADDLQGPYWSPVGDLPRLIIQASVRMQPV